MLSCLWLVPALPFAGFLILAVFGKRLAHRAVALVGVGSIALSAVASLVAAAGFLTRNPAGNAYTQRLWTWIDVYGFRPEIAFYLDPLSLVMAVVVTSVAFLIHLYSAEFMGEDEGYSRFFAYMNLFVASMVILVLANNLVLLYLGWEGVGLCSYLLIGFWYTDPVTGSAARKAFIITRVGDTALIVGLVLLFTHVGTLEIQPLMHGAAAQWPVGSALAVAAAALILGGAVGKSAQLPLQTWLADAMAGPTPTSALLHAATMVTAGVYLIARTHVLFALAPQVQYLVAVVGAATLLLAGFCALAQRDIKRVLAYSTMSQIGYMFLALGVGAWSAAIFHFMTHAFFKALLFLGAGVIIHALNHEHDIMKMGGLRKELPLAFWTFLAAACSLAGIPLITAGSFSKDLIIWEALDSAKGGVGFWIAAVVGVLLTCLYTFRLVFIVFFGKANSPKAGSGGGPAMAIPLVVLAILSIGGGYLNTPRMLGNVHIFSGFLNGALPPAAEKGGRFLTETGSELVVTLVLAAGLAAAYLLFLRKRAFTAALARRAVAGNIHALWAAGFGFDWLYDRVFVRPVLWTAAAVKKDFVDLIYTIIAGIAKTSHRILSLTETGHIRLYAAAIAAGSIIFIALAVLT